MIIYVGPITLWELFKTLCMGMVVSEFNYILFKASRKTFEFIQVDFNENIWFPDEISDEFKAWKNEKKAEDREARLPSNGLLLHLSTKQYPPSTRKVSS